ncbi:MAG: hypothetical protein O7B81_15240, partial [Gammaproteobacteria bacterium]|nr:hypothetical protein [Gammaproteobacteria bacterium]
MTAADLYGEIHQALSHPKSANWIGVDRVRADGDGQYVPDPDGPILAGIVAVMPDDIIIDLVAIDLRRPGRWRRRLGVGDLLGEANTIGLNFTGESLLVHPGPAEWLNAGGDGVAVLEWTPSVCGLLRTITGGLDVADNPDFAELLEAKLTEPERRPTILLQH